MVLIVFKWLFFANMAGKSTSCGYAAWSTFDILQLKMWLLLRRANGVGEASDGGGMPSRGHVDMNLIMWTDTFLETRPLVLWSLNGFILPSSRPKLQDSIK